MLLHHDEQGFRKAAVALAILLRHRFSHLLEKFFDLGVFHHHDMDRARRAAGGFQRGEEYVLFHFEMMCHVIAKLIESGLCLAPVTRKRGFLCACKFIVTGGVVGGHKIGNGFHIELCK